jgi:hypothetical protein
MGQQPRARPAALDRQRGHRRLRHRLAGPAGERGPDVAHHLEPARAVLQDLGDVLAHLAQRAAAGVARAAPGGQVLDITSRQAVRQRLAATAWRLLLGCLGGDGLVLGVVGTARGGDVGQHLVEPQLQLLDLARQALRRSAEPLMPQPRDLHPQPLRLQRLGLQAEFRDATRRAFLGQFAAQRRNHRRQRG